MELIKTFSICFQSSLIAYSFRFRAIDAMVQRMQLIQLCQNSTNNMAWADPELFKGEVYFRKFYYLICNFNKYAFSIILFTTPPSQRDKEIDK